MNMPTSMTNSLIFNYQQEDYEKWLKKFGAHINVQTLSGRVDYPAHVAIGYAKAKVIERGLSYRIVNYSLTSDQEYKRIPSEKFQLLIYFYELNFDAKCHCKVGNTVVESSDGFSLLPLSPIV